MKYVFLITFLLNGCFFGPVQELHDQIEETYFGNDFINPPTPLGEIESDISIDLEVVWQKNIGEHDGSNFDIFIFDEFLFSATSDGTIKKINRITEDILWEKNIESTLTSGISGDDENLIFSTSDGFLWSMNHDGDLIWKTLLESEVNSLAIIYDSKITVKTTSYKIIHLNVKDGSVIWKYQAGIPPLTFKSEGKLVQSNNVVYLGLPGGKLIAIDSPTGGLVWESNISRPRGVTDIERANDMTSHPVIDGPAIYGVTTNGDISALDRRNGKTIWTQPLSSFYGMAFDGFSLFVTHDTGSIYAVNKDDGEIIWRQPSLQFRKIRTGTLIKDYVVFGDYEGYLHFLSIANGNILTRIKLNDSQLLNNIIKIDDSLLFIMSATGDIICLKVGEQVINDKLKVKNIETSNLTDDSKPNEEVNNSKKHRIFDGDEEDFLEEEVLDKVEKKPTKNKKHRVFKNKKEKGILDWLF